MSTMITIYHQTGGVVSLADGDTTFATIFADFHAEDFEPTLKLVYSYEDDSWEDEDSDDPPMFLEGVFQDNNAGAGGREINAQYKMRSLSVGDVVGLPDGTYWSVDGLGWSEVDVDEVEQALNREMVTQ